MAVWEVCVAVYNNLFLSLGSVLAQDPARCVLGLGVEEQRDSVSPHSADSPMSLSSPHQHSSASSVSSLSGSDNDSDSTPCPGRPPALPPYTLQSLGMTLPLGLALGKPGINQQHLIMSPGSQACMSLPSGLTMHSLPVRQNGPKFHVKGFHNPAVVHSPALANRAHTHPLTHAHTHSHTQYRNTWRRRKRDSLPVSLSR
nr:non-canonical poly(A) RNA polymerase PAPD7-like isoform X2 [Salvelinus alpinus]